MKNLVGIASLVAVYAYFIVSYTVNIIQFFKCDFDSPYKDEIIKLIGVLLPPTAGITVWF